jgi:predicted amidohydrolase YtcJ
MGSASVMWSEGELGTLEPGKLADFIVVDVDPLTIPEGDLRRVRVLETYVEGVRVYP